MIDAADIKAIKKVEPYHGYGIYYTNETVRRKEIKKGKKGYVCKICGYVYEGDKLPDDYICPLCKHGVADFEEIK